MNIGLFIKALKHSKYVPISLIELLWEQKENIGKAIAGLSFILILPILFICMLPSFLFGSFGSLDALNNQSVIMKNIQEYQSAIWSVIDEAHDKILEDIQYKINALDESEKGIISDNFSYGTVNTMLILSQYSVFKGTEEFNTDDVISIIKTHIDKLFYYDVKTLNENGIKTYTYIVNYIGDDYFVDNIFKLNEFEKKIALYYTENTQKFLYGNNLGSVSSQVSDEVLEYSDLIRKYAKQFGISNFFDVICAVMMAESGGRVPDVMQASECPYNKKYPTKSNGITDPEYSIEVGIHYLSDCLNSAGCISPSQTDKLSLALQGYNFGNGYISWALEKYGGYSESNAIEFSNMMKEKLGWNTYGNPKYVSNVFKYLIFSSNGKWGSPFIGKDWNSAVSSEFGYRTDPINGSSAFHEGLDIAYPTGTPINAISGGVVTSVVFSKTGYGNHIRVDCGEGVVVLYAHCSDIFVTKGQTITAGQVIANVGATGRVTGPHLHLGVLLNGNEVNPRQYIN
ncbi:hypothetical protein B5E58_04455 [Tyzzerella sp. An114]|uniref:lysozyme family protein n=1 Tax=Tyzzerella sp. An114 TaxID=1965545 RepID=UPI000B42F460|nr:lysozyme family protein [Tyzzerella sp. An114]OUQ59692.1 hypothetical protein B5E58_04455 [Tyzzerella sp. An114]